MQQTPFYSHYLRQELVRRCEKNGRYSLRAFARAIGLDAGALSLILSGKRVPSHKIAKRLLPALDLSPEEESNFLSSVAEAQRARGLERLSPVFRTPVLRTIDKNTGPVHELDPELFRVIADWYHYAILELTFTPEFKASPKWIASQLGITETEAALAVERLLGLGLLKRERGKLSKVEKSLTTAQKELTTPALRRHQKQILEKSLASLENDPIESRSHTSMAMAIDPAKLPEAKKMVEEFTQKLCAFLEDGKRTQVYELGVSLYPVQKRNKKK